MLTYDEFMTGFCDQYRTHLVRPGNYQSCPHRGHGPHWVEPTEGVVYYLFFAEVELIKIGCTTDIKARVQSLKPDAVLALEQMEDVGQTYYDHLHRQRRHPKLYELEQQRHVQHAASQCHDEYFHATDELVDFIRDLKYDFAAAVEQARCADCQAKASETIRCARCQGDRHYAEFLNPDGYGQRARWADCASCRAETLGQVRLRRPALWSPKPCAHQVLVA